MDTDPDVRVLRLTIENDKVEYIYATAFSAQTGSLNDGWDKGKQALARDSLSDQTITTLIEQLTLLSDLLRDKLKEVNEEEEKELLNKLGNVVKVLGEHLYHVLFKGKVEGDSGGAESYLNDALNQVKLDLALIRVEIECKDQNLAAWPWEYLYKPPDDTSNCDDFLVNLAKQLVLNRRLYRSGPLSNLKTPRPVKVLLVSVQPKDLGIVWYEPVRTYLKELQTLGVVQLEEIIDIYPPDILARAKYEPLATRKYIQQRISDVIDNGFGPHIIHFIGHGSRSKKVGRIGLIMEGGEADWLEDFTFAKWLASSRSLKLVFLQACESALPDPYRAASGMAMQLAQKNIPAVIAMQYKIDNESASNFALGFYKALAEGKSVDLAVKVGREEINKGGEEQQIYAFGLPILYLRSYERIILPEENKPAPGVQRESENTDEWRVCPRCQRNQKTINHVCINAECHLRFRCIFCEALFEDPLNDPYCAICEAYRECQDKNCHAEFSKWNTTRPVLSPLDHTYCIKCKPKYQQSGQVNSYVGPDSHLPINSVTMHQ